MRVTTFAVGAAPRAGFMLMSHQPTSHLPAGTVIRSPTTQICEGTNQIQRMVMGRQPLKG
jgi:hypothetical protein